MTALRRLLSRLVSQPHTYCCAFHARRARARGVIGGNRWPL